MVIQVLELSLDPRQSQKVFRASIGRFITYLPCSAVNSDKCYLLLWTVSIVIDHYMPRTDLQKSDTFKIDLYPTPKTIYSMQGT